MRLLLLFVLTCSASISGCNFSGASQREKGTITGQVMLSNAPLTEGLVNFFAPATGDSGSAEIDAAGHFKISLPAGEYRVHVTPPASPPPGDPAVLPQAESKIPKKYQNSSTSGLIHIVKSGKNDLNIKLE